MSELMNHTADQGQAAMFSKAWYNDYFRRAGDSPAHTRRLQADFEAEGNGFLCEARMAEYGWSRDHAETGTLVRYLFVIQHNPRLASGRTSGET